MKVDIVGTGYLGLSGVILFAQHHKVVALHIVRYKVAMFNRKKSAIGDAEIEAYLQHKPLNLCATLDKREAFDGAEFVIIATPTDYYPDTKITVIVYGPVLNDPELYHSRVLEDLAAFKRGADVIIANRISDDIHDAADKVYTRELFESDQLYDTAEPSHDRLQPAGR